MNRWTYIIVLLICCSVFAFGQTRNDTDLSLSDLAQEVAERNAAQGFNDTIDRTAEDLPLPATGWSWLIIPFNILPAICWKWRKKWALPYVIVIALWCICMLCATHRLVEYTHIILATSFGIILLKQKYMNR